MPLIPAPKVHLDRTWATGGTVSAVYTLQRAMLPCAGLLANPSGEGSQHPKQGYLKTSGP